MSTDWMIKLLNAASEVSSRAGDLLGRAAGNPRKLAVFGGGGAVVLVLILILLFAGGSTGLLDEAELSEAQIRTVAKDLLIHDDPKIRARASEKLHQQGERAVPVLKAIGVAAGDIALRRAVIGVLVSLDQDAAGQVLDAMMADEDEGIRIYAVRTATTFEHPSARSVLAKGIEDPSPSVRSVATAAAGSAGMTGAAEVLRKAAEDENPAVRRHAERALRDLERPRH